MCIEKVKDLGIRRLVLTGQKEKKGSWDEEYTKTWRIYWMVRLKLSARPLGLIKVVTISLFRKWHCNWIEYSGKNEKERDKEKAFSTL